MVQLKETTKFVVSIVDDDNNLPYDHVILCNAELFPVTARVYSDLQNTMAAGWQYLWIREVCVDQSNLVESSQQAALAPDIYRSALHIFKSIARFRYGPMLQKDQIRLLDLHPINSTNTTLRANLRTASLAENPHFAKLEIVNVPVPEEYQTKGRILICNEQGLRIDSVIYHALEILRSSPCYALWIESICVNQEDPDEMSYCARLQEQIDRKALQKLAVNRANYQYRPLDEANSEIRLLRIHPARSIGSPLLIEIFTASLNDKLDYVSLSYEWGSSVRDHGILCTDGTIMRITKHLFLSLRELRQNSYKVVWADQICINQKDNEERSQQLLMMNRIYSQATSVVVELKAFCENSKHLSCHHDWLVLMRILSLTRRTLQAIRPDHARLEPDELSKFGLPPPSHRSWRMWQALRGQSWFSRVWVIQEVAASPNIWAICNNRVFAWDDLIAANNAFGNEVMPSARKTAHLGRMTLHNLDHLRSPQGPVRHSLLKLVSTFRFLQSSDPRDKIYAFHAMAADADGLPRPDYSQSVEQIYHSFARYFVSKGQGMEVLCEASISRSALDIPSWVVDWSYTTDFYTLHHSIGASRACLNYQARKSNAEVVLTDDPSTISAKGAIVDMVLSTTPAVRWSTDDKSSLISGHHIFMELDLAAHKLLEQREDYRSKYGAGTLEAYARTIIGNDTRFTDAVALYEKSKTQLGGYQDDEQKDDSPTVLWPKDKEYYRCRDANLEERRFGITRNGDMGLFPIPTLTGDAICIFQGCKAPFVVRKQQTAYTLIGDAYVHGLMQGEGSNVPGTHYKPILIR